MSIPTNVCSFPLLTVIFLNSDSSCSIIFVTTLGSWWDNLYRQRTKWLYMFSHLSHNLLKPMVCSLPTKVLHQSIALCIHPYRALMRRTYNTFFPFSSVRNFLNVGLTWHSSSGDSPTIWIMTKSFISDSRKAPVTSAVATSLPSNMSIRRDNWGYQSLP